MKHKLKLSLIMREFLSVVLIMIETNQLIDICELLLRIPVGKGAFLSYQYAHQPFSVSFFPILSPVLLFP